MTCHGRRHKVILLIVKRLFNCDNADRDIRVVVPLPGCGRLDSPHAIRQLMKRVTTHQLKGELSPQAQSAINGSAGLALKTLHLGEFEDSIALVESKLEAAVEALAKKHKKCKKGKQKSKIRKVE